MSNETFKPGEAVYCSTFAANLICVLIPRKQGIGYIPFPLSNSEDKTTFTSLCMAELVAAAESIDVLVVEEQKEAFLPFLKNAVRQTFNHVKTFKQVGRDEYFRLCMV